MSAVVRPPASEWICAERAVVDEFGPLLEIHRAIVQRDDAALWRTYRTTRNQVAYLDWIANIAGGRVVDGAPRKGARYETLAAIPVILPSGPTWGGSMQPWVLDDLQLQLRFRDWLPLGHSIVLNNCLTPYASVGQWAPVRQRDALASLAEQRAVMVEHVDRPHQQHLLSQLFFVLASVRRHGEDTDLPELASPAELRLREAIAAQVGLAIGKSMELDSVLGPMRFSQAIQTGIECWLGRLLAGGFVGSWDLVPVGDDAVRLDLWDVDDCAVEAMPLRLHQLEPCGIDLIAATLQDALGSSRRPATLTTVA